MEFTTFTLGDLDTNCYLVWDEVSGSAVIIDPADEGGFLSEEILHRGLDLQHIILTHGHFDHVLGLLELCLNFPVPVWMHPGDEFLLARAAASAAHWLKRPVDPVPPTFQPLQENQTFQLGDHTLQVLHTPGHTPGSVALFTPEYIWTGDTLFADSIGSADHAYSNKKQLWKSITELKEAHQGTLALPGHGQSFLV